MIVSAVRESKALMTPKLCNLIRCPGAIDWYTQHHPCALHFSSLVVLP